MAQGRSSLFLNVATQLASRDHQDNATGVGRSSGPPSALQPSSPLDQSLRPTRIVRTVSESVTRFHVRLVTNQQALMMRRSFMPIARATSAAGSRFQHLLFLNPGT